MSVKEAVMRDRWNVVPVGAVKQRPAAEVAEMVGDGYSFVVTLGEMLYAYGYAWGCGRLFDFKPAEKYDGTQDSEQRLFGELRGWAEGSDEHYGFVFDGVVENALSSYVDKMGSREGDLEQAIWDLQDTAPDAEDGVTLSDGLQDRYLAGAYRAAKEKVASIKWDYDRENEHDMDLPF